MGKYSDIKIPSFKNEKEFNQEIDDILLLTKDTGGDWKKREAAIKKIGGIILSNYSLQFIKIFNQKIYLNLSTQLLDLRSSVMKEACRIAVLSTEVYKMNIEFAVDKLMSPSVIFKLVGSANKVISEAAFNTLEEMIKHLDSVKVLERLYEQMKNKCNNVRLRASQIFLYVLKNYSDKILSKNFQMIEEFINTIVHDANGECRAVARKMYLIYLNQNETRAKKLFNLFDNQMKKVINEESQVETENRSSNYTSTKYTDSNKLISSPQKTDSSGKTFDYQNNKIFSNSAGMKLNNNKNMNNLTSETSQENYLKLEKNIVNNELYTNKPFSKTETKTLASKLNRITLEEDKDFSKSPNFNNKNIESKKISNLQNNFMIQTNKINKNDSLKKSNPAYSDSFNNNTDKSVFSTNTNGNFSLNEKIFSQNSHIPQESCNSNYSTKINNINTSYSKKANNEVVEFEISYLNKYLTIINFDSNIGKKIEIFQLIENNFAKIYSEFESIPSYIIKSLIETLINFLSNSQSTLSITVMKVLSKLFFYIDEIFNEDDLGAIIKLVVINLASTNEAVTNQANDLFEIMVGKIDIIFLIQIVIEIFDLDIECRIKIKCVEILYFLVSETVHKKCEIEKKILSEINNKLIECINKYINDANKNLYKILIEKAKSLIDYIHKNFPNIKIVKNQNHVQNEEFYNKYTTIPATPIPKVKEDFFSAIIRHSTETLISYIKSDPFTNLEKFLNCSCNINNYEYLNAYLNHLQNILINSADIFINNEEILMEKIIKLFQKFLNEFHEKFKDILFMIGSKIDSNEFFSNMTKYINRKENPLIVQVIIETITNLIKFFDIRSLKVLTPIFIKSLVECLDHPIPNVRKQSVYCIVELYFSLGAEFEVFLNGVDLSHKNLIYLYLKKKKENI
jgi:hypothetical protein